MIHLIVLMNEADTLDKLKELFGVEKFLEIRTYKDGNQIKADIKINTNDTLEAETIYKIISENDFIISLERIEEI